MRWALNGLIGCQLRGRFRRTQRALALALTEKNGMITAAGLKVLGGGRGAGGAAAALGP